MNKTIVTNVDKNKNLAILLEVCDYTGYEIMFKDGLIVCIDTYGSGNVLSYKSVEDALIGWLPTMVEQFEGCDEIQMWKNEIKYVKEMKKKIELKKFLYENMHIEFHGNTTDDGFGLSCEFTIDAHITPLIHLGKKEHYCDTDNMISDIYTEFTWGRVEKCEDTGKISIWIFEPTIDCGGEFLHNIKTLHYDTRELEKEIIKRWKEFSK